MAEPDFSSPRNAVALWTGYGLVNSGNPLPVSATVTATFGAFQPTALISLSVSNTSSRTALPDSNPTLVIVNPFNISAYVILGNSSVVATTSGFPVPANSSVGLAVGTATYIAAITANGTTTLSIATGLGVPVFGSIVPSSQGNYADRSGTISNAGASQSLCAVNLSRRRLFVQNPSAASESLFLNFTSPATINTATSAFSIELLPGGSFDTGNGPCTTEAVTIIGATAGHAFSAKEM